MKLRWDGRSWYGDNRAFVVDVLLPNIELSADVLQVLRWAYGCDGSIRSFEEESDGSTVVPDWFMGKLLKDPMGVGHDMIFILHHLGLPDPSGHHWTFMESNFWYGRAYKEMGYPTIGKLRGVGLNVVGIFHWKFGGKKYKKYLKEGKRRRAEEKAAMKAATRGLEDAE